MKPYKNKRLTEGPDVADIMTEGRKSSVGRLKTGQVYTDYPDGIVSDAEGNYYGIQKVCRNGERGYLKSKKKKVARRHLKRADKAKTELFDRKAA